MQPIDGSKWKPPAPKPVLKKAKTGGLIDAIKKAAEASVPAKAEKLGQALKQAAEDSDQTLKGKSPSATSRLGLGNHVIGAKQRISAAQGDGNL